MFVRVSRRVQVMVHVLCVYLCMSVPVLMNQVTLKQAVVVR